MECAMRRQSITTFCRRWTSSRRMPPSTVPPVIDYALHASAIDAHLSRHARRIAGAAARDAHAEEVYLHRTAGGIAGAAAARDTHAEEAHLVRGVRRIAGAVAA